MYVCSADCCKAKVITWMHEFGVLFSVFCVYRGSTEDVYVSHTCDVSQNNPVWLLYGDTW